MAASESSANYLLLRIVRDIADYQFGRGVGERLFPDNCKVEISKRTRRPKYIYLEGEILATIRYPDNLLALTLAGARRLLEITGSSALKVIVKKTKDACNEFNKYIKEKRKVVAAFHLTC